MSDQVYRLLKEEIEGFIENRDRYVYSQIGVVLCLLHIPHKFKNQYFCSQFVAEILAHAGAVELKKKESLYLPSHLLYEMQSVCSDVQVAYDLI